MNASFGSHRRKRILFFLILHHGKCFIFVYISMSVIHIYVSVIACMCLYRRQLCRLSHIHVSVIAYSWVGYRINMGRLFACMHLLLNVCVLLCVCLLSKTSVSVIACFCLLLHVCLLFHVCLLSRVSFILCMHECL